MSELLIGLAGGAIGAVLTGIGFVVLRLSAVPGDVARHDRRTAALDEDLERWVADDHRRLRQELDRTTNEYAAKGLHASSIHLGERAEVKSRALQRYRDRRSESERALADIMAEEGWPHERWRRWKRLPDLKLTALERVAPVIYEWRTAATVAGMEDAAQVYDPTRWTTDDLLRDLSDRPLERRARPESPTSIRVELREAWCRPSSGRTDFGPTTDQPDPVSERDIFEVTVVAINVSNQPVYVEVLGVESASEPVGFDDRHSADVREVPPGGNVSLIIDEETARFNMRSGVRGFAELATGPTIWSELLIPALRPMDPR